VRTVVVTGATSGIGEASVRTFLENDYLVVAIGRRIDRLQALVTEFGATKVHSINRDVRDFQGLAAAFNEIPERFQSIRCLVNNAGLLVGENDVIQSDTNDWDTMIDTNIKGVLHAIKAVLPFLLQGGGGHIINVASIAAYYPYMGGNVYAASKAFVHQLSLNLKTEFVAKNIRVSCVSPGKTSSEFFLVKFKGDEKKAKAAFKSVMPLEPVDVANAIYWVASQPQHININVLELMPSNQPFGLG